MAAPDRQNPDIVEALVSVYRIIAVCGDGTAVVLASAETASEALEHIREAFDRYPRAWITDETNTDVSVGELMRRATEEQKKC